MIVRLGNVLYWAGCSIAALVAVFGIWAGFHESTGQGWEVFGFFEVGAAITWTMGRACRYVLAGT